MTDANDEQRRFRQRRAVKRVGIIGTVLLGALWIVSRRAEVCLRWDRFGNAALRLDSVMLRAGGVQVIHATNVPVDRAPAGWQFAGRWDHGQAREWMLMVRHPSHYWYIFIPLWAPFAACAGVAAWMIWRDRRSVRWGRTGCCTACGYSLTGNTTGICPECGASAPAAARPTPTTKSADPANTAR